jgi:hypothetical protein
MKFMGYKAFPAPEVYHNKRRSGKEDKPRDERQLEFPPGK